MVVILNDLCPELDEEWNGEFYDEETPKTGVIYMIWNVEENKAYIGRADSFVKIGIDDFKRHGAKKRFRIHWTNKKNIYNKKSRAVCRLFYEALCNSDILDWFVFTLKICPLEELREWETKLIKKYKTSDPNFGYNLFVGNNKPDNPEHLKEYLLKKAASNTKRAVGGKMKRTETNKNLPTYISYYPVKKGDKLICEGYMARITINGKPYKKVFITMEDSMDEKLEKAKTYIESLKTDVNNDTLVKGKDRKLDKSKGLPKNIRYYTSKWKGQVVGEGYCVEMRINGERYQKVFTSKDESMKFKLAKAKKQIKIFKKQAEKNSKKSGSKTAKKKY